MSTTVRQTIQPLSNKLLQTVILDALQLQRNHIIHSSRISELFNKDDIKKLCISARGKFRHRWVNKNEAVQFAAFKPNARYQWMMNTLRECSNWVQKATNTLEAAYLPEPILQSYKNDPNVKQTQLPKYIKQALISMQLETVRSKTSTSRKRSREELNLQSDSTNLMEKTMRDVINVEAKKDKHLQSTLVATHKKELNTAKKQMSELNELLLQWSDGLDPKSALKVRNEQRKACQVEKNNRLNQECSVCFKQNGHHETDCPQSIM